MSTNTKALQRQAAALVMRGKNTDNICETLKIRPSTLTRWRREAVFQQELAALKREWQQDIEVQAIRQTSNALFAMNYEFYKRTPTIGMAADMVGILKNIFKNNCLDSETPQNQHESAGKWAKSAGISKKAGKTSADQRESDHHIQDSAAVPVDALAQGGDGVPDHGHQ